VVAVPVHFEVPPALPALPAAVEVAAYRICLEAIQNVVNHAQARICVLHLAHDDHGLTVQVTDDGRGIPTIHPVGLGLRSMTERASELGGTLTVLAGPHGRGTQVRAVLPCRPSQATAPPVGSGTDRGLTTPGGGRDEHSERADLR
jgi:signal transduction histidine kinase